MKNLPDKIYLRRGEARDYLELSEESFTKLVRAGVLRPRYLPGMTRALYKRDEVAAVQPKEKQK